ncbi:MAG: hypothetical protein DRG78_18320 [Epsilonproteobacteria bacterium]|nr:MAG: hypothetical protein DRG78_18320 [Campylobacterota bacterium]
MNDYSLKNKTVFIGIGAQKAGTSWLNDTLSNYANLITPHIKELHYFDIKWLDYELNTVAIYKGRAKELKQISSNVSDTVQNKSNEFQRKKNKSEFFLEDYLEKYELEKKCERIIALANILSIKNDIDYIRYFYNLGKNKDIIGEITPSYSLLPVEGFMNIKTLIPHAKIIFLMRDPIDRFVSQLKFKRKTRLSSGLGEYDIHINFENKLHDNSFIHRSDYERVILSIEKIFDVQNILILFYEELLFEDTVNEYRKIESYLNLEKKDEQEILSWREKKSNATEEIDIKPELKKMAGKKFKHIYEYIFERFSNVPQKWKDNYREFCV